MAADRTAKRPQSLVPLPKAQEIPLLDAVYWIAFGAFPAPTTLNSNERAVFDKRERAFEDWCRSQPGLSSRQYVVNQAERQKMAVAVEDVKHLWPSRGKLDDAGLRFLRLSIRAARLHRSFAKRFEQAQADFLEAAWSGLVSVRAKTRSDDAIPEPLDPAYFRNPVEIKLPSGDLVRARRSYAEQSGGSDRSGASLNRYAPLVSVSDLASAFAKPSNQASDGPILKEARAYMNERGQDRVLRQDLRVHLEKAGFEIGARPFDRICKKLSEEFPNAFRRGRPAKK